MGKSKVRTLLIACVMIMLCTAMIIGGTFALWSDNKTITNHLSAGTLNVSLTRIGHTKKTLDENGYLKTNEVTNENVDFSASTTENVFGLSEGEVIVPCASYEARLKLTNSGDVAISYGIAIQLGTCDTELKSQLKVSVKIGDGAWTTKSLSEITTGTLAIVTDQALTKNAAQEFSVKVEFADAENNNAAKGQEANFDLLVTAIQKTNA